MFYDTGCYGRVTLGPLPTDVQRRLAALPGEWLEYDPDEGAIVGLLPSLMLDEPPEPLRRNPRHIRHLSPPVLARSR